MKSEKDGEKVHGVRITHWYCVGHWIFNVAGLYVSEGRLSSAYVRGFKETGIQGSWRCSGVHAKGCFFRKCVGKVLWILLFWLEDFCVWILGIASCCISVGLCG